MNWPKPIRMVWSAWSVLWMLCVTVPVACLVVLSGKVGFSHNQIQLLARLWARLLIYGLGCRVSVVGLDNIEKDQTYVFASNHASALDIPALLAVLPKNFRWIAKQELFDMPIFGPSLKAAGYIPVDRGDNRKSLKSILMAVERIKSGASVVIFPEGTRSDDGDLLPFKPGGFMLALRSGRPVVPVAVVGSHQALKAKSLLINPGRITVVVGKPIPVKDLKGEEREALSDYVRRQVQRLLDSHQGAAPGQGD